MTWHLAVLFNMPLCSDGVNIIGRSFAAFVDMRTAQEGFRGGNDIGGNLAREIKLAQPCTGFVMRGIWS
jgi:hypothetical protein